MFKKIRALSKTTDMKLRFEASQPYHFAAGEILLPICTSEAEMVSREYVIVFSAEAGNLPSAVVGVQQGVNAYVQPSGHWIARYIPAHIRRYPFILGEKKSETQSADAKRNFTIMIDEDAPHLSMNIGQPLINEDGSPAEVLTKAEQLLLALQQDIERTRLLVEQIDQAGLLAEKPLQVRLKSGPTADLKGLRIVDREKVAQCSAQQLHDLMRTGALPFIFAHLISLNNLVDSALTHAGGPKDMDFDDLISFGGSSFSTH